MDLLPGIDGVDTELAVRRAEPGTLFGESTRFISRGDLLTNKRATGRPRDAVDADMIDGESV